VYAKTAEPIEMSFGRIDASRSKEPIISVHGVHMDAGCYCSLFNFPGEIAPDRFIVVADIGGIVFEFSYDS